MNRSILAFMAFLLLVPALASCNGIAFHEGLDPIVARNSGHDMVPASSYTPHGPITITNDGEFSSQGWPGNGTEGDPYVIEGLNITATGTCILVASTSVYFEIRGCLVTASESSGSPGIYFSEVYYGTVRDCIISLHSYGVSYYLCCNCTAVNNTATENGGNGFWVASSFNCTLTNNTAVGNGLSGFRLQQNEAVNSKGCILMNNTAVDNAENGFYVYYSDSSVFTNNTATNNTENGFRVYESQSTVLTNNTASINGESGFYVQMSGSSVLTDNTAAGNALNGFYAYYSDGCVLTDNTARDSGNVGLFLHFSNACILTGNISTKDPSGIYVETSHHCIVMGNTVHNSSNIAIGVSQSQQCNITSNTATLNDNAGIAVYFSSGTDFTLNDASRNVFGFYVYDSHNNTLADNAASENYLYGFYLYVAENHTLRNNTAISNDRYGIYLEESSNCTLFLNRLDSNGLSNGLDDGGSDNSWDNGTHGNYWNDYDGEGVYDVPGTTGSMDHYPFLLDMEAPSINDHGDITYDEGATGHYITWSPHDSHPSTYAVYLDGGLLKAGQWNSTSETIVLSVDGHGLGTYNYTIIVTDTSLNTAVDTVLVTVRDGTPPTIDHPADITYVVGATGHSITWNASDAHPAFFMLYRDGVITDPIPWNGDPIVIDADGRGVGTHNYTIFVTDVGENTVADVVLVIVTAVITTTTTTTTTTTSTTATTTTTTTSTTTSTTGQTTPPDNIMAIVGVVAGAGVLVVVAIVLLRMRKKG